MQGGSNPGTAAAECPQDVEEWAAARLNAEAALRRFEGMSQAERVAHLARALEFDVIPRLAATHRGPLRDAAVNDAHMPLVSPAEIEAFTDQVIVGEEPSLDAYVAALRAAGGSVPAILMDLLAPAARRFGTLWEDDRCDFSTVTVGLGRLQRLMRELSPAFGTEVEHPPHGRRVLLVRAPTEQHSFGMSMVAEFFRRSGWEVIAGGGSSDVDPVDAVRREWFDLVGFSAGSEERIEWLPDCIATVRRASRNRMLSVLVGGPAALLLSDLAERVGADAASTDGSTAPALAERLLAGRVKRS